MERRDFSSVVWELVFVTTGFRKEEIDNLREHNVAAASKDVCELINRDLEWTERSTIEWIRRQLQSYIAALRELKSETSSGKVSRTFVEQKRYKALRSREAANRVTSSTIAKSFEQLNLSTKKINVLDSGVTLFSNVKDFVVSRNLLDAIDYIPPACEVLLASGNLVCRLNADALAASTNLVVLGLSHNRVEDISFLLNSFSVVCVDLSFNRICDVDHCAEVIAQHPSVKDLRLNGCPVTLAYQYRRCIVSRCGNLQQLDGVSVTEAERSDSKIICPPAAGFVPTFIFTFNTLQGLVAIAPTAEESARGGSASAKKASKDKKGTKDEERPPIARQSTFSLDVQWNGACLSVSNVDCIPPLPQAEETATKGKPSKKSSPETVPTAVDEMPLKAEVSAPLQLSNDTTEALSSPAIVELTVTDTVILPSGSKTSFPLSLGSFVLDMSTAVTAKRATVTAPLILNQRFVTDARARLNKMSASLNAMVQEDAQLDALLAEAISSDTSGFDAGVPPAAGKKPQGKQSRQPQLSDLTLQKQSDSLARKAVIDELNQQLGNEERRFERLRQAQLLLTATLELQSEPVEKLSPVERPPVAPPSSKKK
jgi:hypothetical protein